VQYKSRRLAIGRKCPEHRSGTMTGSRICKCWNRGGQSCHGQCSWRGPVSELRALGSRARTRRVKRVFPKKLWLVTPQRPLTTSQALHISTQPWSIDGLVFAALGTRRTLWDAIRFLLMIQKLTNETCGIAIATPDAQYLTHYTLSCPPITCPST
jgi:hypothetical protein